MRVVFFFFLLLLSRSIPGLVNSFPFQIQSYMKPRDSKSRIWTRLFMASIQELQSKIQIFNSATRSKEPFVPLDPPKVSFYSCGPTVYDYAHIGNFRAFLTYDILKRWLSYCGYDVNHVCNLTDIDDKIIIKMANEGKSLTEITTKYGNAFFEDLEVLNIKKANTYPKATEYINEMEQMISSLLQSNHAYTQRGSVYYRVSAFKSYGEFAGMKFDENVDGAGVIGPNQRRGQDDKESNQDFALWKAYSPQDLDVYWNSKFGRGRPGWHIECSAMCCKLLGNTIDIHAGGIDLVFPHHQNEIAQSEAYTDTLKSAINSLKRIDKAITKLQDLLSKSDIASNENENIQSIMNVVHDGWKGWEDAMCDDMNTPKAVSYLFIIISTIEKASNHGELTPRAAKNILTIIEKIDSVFGILYTVPSSYFTSINPTNVSTTLFVNAEEKLLEVEQVPKNILELANRRAELKVSKQYDEADKLRQELLSIGYVVKDKKGGGFDIYQK